MQVALAALVSPSARLASQRGRCPRCRGPAAGRRRPLTFRLRGPPRTAVPQERVGPGSGRKTPPACWRPDLVEEESGGDRPEGVRRRRDDSEERVDDRRVVVVEADDSATSSGTLRPDARTAFSWRPRRGNDATTAVGTCASERSASMASAPPSGSTRSVCTISSSSMLRPASCIVSRKPRVRSRAEETLSGPAMSAIRSWPTATRWRTRSGAPM